MNLQHSFQKLDLELREIKQGLGRANKSQEVRALQHLDLSTKELSNKVTELRKMKYMGQDNTPLRY